MSKRSIFRVLPLLGTLCLFLGGLLSAQQARPMKKVFPGTQGTPDGISLDSENSDTSALLFRETMTESIWVCVSDGRGLGWSVPIRLDDDTSSAPKKTHKHSVTVDGDRIYAAWLDERNGAKEDLFFTASLDQGATWSASNIRIDDGFSSGSKSVKDYRIASSGDDIIALMSTANGSEELYLAYSNDGGATWSSAEDATLHNGVSDVDDIDLACSEDYAYIAWRDNFSNGVDDTVWLSVFDIKHGNFLIQDLDVSPNLSLSGGDADDGVGISVDEDCIAVIFHADNMGSSAEQIRVNLSSDLGASWTGDFQVGQYDNSTSGHDVDNGVVLVEDSIVAVAWQDNRSGQDEVYCAYAGFVTAVFTADHLCSNSTIGAGAPRIAGEFSGEALAVSWSQFDGRTYSSCYLRNGIWSGTFVVSENTGDVRNVRIAWNDVYNNFLSVWISDESGAEEIFYGGYRTQQVAEPNLVAGTLGSISLSGFFPGETFQVVASKLLGNLTFPDGRNLGLTYDNILGITKSLAPFGGLISASGTGTTSPVTVPGGLSGVRLYFAAVSFDASGGFSDISDTVIVDIQ